MPGAILVSIHQNHFSEGRYHGAQVFYAAAPGSDTLAEGVQTALRMALNPDNNRQIKPGSAIYLLEEITCPGILVECGFLSMPMRPRCCSREPIRQSWPAPSPARC